MGWDRINQRLRRKLPVVHAALKRGFSSWRLGADPLVPALRRIRGEFFWVHPRLLTADTRDHEPHVYRWVRDHLQAGSVFFDVGAHYGWHALPASHRAGTGGRVVAFEASPVLVEILKYHQRRNRLRQMTVVAGAVSGTDRALADFYLLNGGLSSRNSLIPGRPGLPFLDADHQTAARVPVLRLDTFCEEEHLAPDVIKIDVEGAEGMVLRGAAAILERHRPVLVVSMHPYWFPPTESTRGILDFTFRFGYRIQDSRLVSFEGYEIGDYLLAPSRPGSR